MYLENIFIDSEDIQKQLPAEFVLFTSVHEAFQQKMDWLHSTKLVKESCTSKDILEAFSRMDENLEKVQKSLDEYLEQKRQQFPRFYFLSSDDLLEILGQAKDPTNIQPHLKKCFEGKEKLILLKISYASKNTFSLGVKRLDIQSIGGVEVLRYQSGGLWSPDGEYLPFATPVNLTGPSEEWLNEVEAAMFQATKTQLIKTLEDSKSTLYSKNKVHNKVLNNILRYKD